MSPLMTSSVSETFAFACSDQAWWELVRNEEEDALGAIEEADGRAFAAAREHVTQSASDLLRACFKSFQATTPTGTSRFSDFKGNKFQSKRASTEAWCWLDIYKGKAKESQLFLAIERGWDDDETMRLYAYANSSPTLMQDFRRTLGRRKNVGRQDEGRWYFFDVGLPITSGASFDTMAATLAEKTWPLLIEYHHFIRPYTKAAAQ